MRVYRCTRNKPYRPDTIGHRDTTARQGHYIKANSVEEALAQMQKNFPGEKKAGFTAEVWAD